MPQNTTEPGAARGGTLRVRLLSRILDRPIAGARITILYTGGPSAPLYELLTDENGFTANASLAAPSVSYSLTPSLEQPYAEYTVRAEADGFEPTQVAGAQLLPGEASVQEIRLDPSSQGAFRDIVIPAHTLFGDYPEKIPETEQKPVAETGEIVLSRVVIPEYIVVHDGAPTDSTAKDYYVRYRDYIKNVASSEIYATWPEETIRANVLAIMSFTLNRVYTEWYRNKGYDFTITSSTAFDHKWTYGRNIFDSISAVVDKIFENYLSRPNVRQPILTQYCDGNRVTCPNWMSQWGSKSLGDEGYTAIEILRYYYGDDLYINTAEEISGVPASWPGEDLTIGSGGQKVTQLQEQLDAIARVYSSIPSVSVTGIYDEATQEAVQKFQSIFGLGESGVVDYPTWYKIQEIYVGISRIAEAD